MSASRTDADGERALRAHRLRRTIPYFIALAITIALFVLASRIDFVAAGGRIGPDFWPKSILALAIITCAFQIVKTLFFADEQVAGVLESIIEEAPAEAEADSAPQRTYPRMIVAGVMLTIAYVLLIEHLGFFLSTFAYLAAFIWVGHYRRPLIVLASSLIGSLAFMFVFMKIVYVSLPLGQEPFAQVTFFLMRLMSIR